MLILNEIVRSDSNHKYYVGVYEQITLELWEILNNLSINGTHEKIKNLIMLIYKVIDTDEDFLKHVKVINSYYVLEELAMYPHFVSTCCFAIWFGIKLNLRKELVLMIGMAAILHDIGKLGISKSIINKPDKLSADEIVEIRKHPLYGYRFISKARDTFPTPVMESILYHHERINRTGYPFNKNLSELQVIIKIIAIVDCFDAMTTNRVYDDGKPILVVIDELLADSGKILDADTTILFCNYIKKLYCSWVFDTVGNEAKGLIRLNEKIDLDLYEHLDQAINKRLKKSN